MCFVIGGFTLSLRPPPVFPGHFNYCGYSCNFRFSLQDFLGIPVSLPNAKIRLGRDGSVRIQLLAIFNIYMHLAEKVNSKRPNHSSHL